MKFWIILIKTFNLNVIFIQQRWDLLKMINLTFYGGVGEIGGNKILLEDADTKIFLDFGMSFGKRSLFFEEFLTPRTANGIGDFLKMRLIPDIYGIYRSDLIEHIGRKSEETQIQGSIMIAEKMINYLKNL